MLRVSARTAAALENGRITLAKARILGAETLNLSEQHTTAQERTELARRERVLDEYARRAGAPGDERGMDTRRGDALVDLVLNPGELAGYGRSLPPRPATSLPKAPVDASSPTRTPVAPWATAPPATGHQPNYQVRV